MREGPKVGASSQLRLPNWNHVDRHDFRRDQLQRRPSSDFVQRQGANAKRTYLSGLKPLQCNSPQERQANSSLA
jgi:hypothetical protein